MAGDVFGGGEDGTEEFAGKEAVEAGFFGERNELIGRDEAALRDAASGRGLRSRGAGRCEARREAENTE